MEGPETGPPVFRPLHGVYRGGTSAAGRRFRPPRAGWRPASRPGGGAGPSLAIIAAEAGRRVYYGTLAGLIDSLTEAKTAAGNLSHRLRVLTHPGTEPGGTTSRPRWELLDHMK